MIDQEYWSDIPEYPDYQVSTHGFVRNVRTENQLTPVVMRNGYLTVKLYNEYGYRQLYVARLVAEAFLDDHRDNVRIGFVDGNARNCHISNLIVRGDRVRYFRDQPARKTGRRVLIIETDQIFRSVHKCARYINGDPRAIYRVLRGTQHRHMGYTFKWMNVEESLYYARKGKIL